MPKEQIKISRRRLLGLAGGAGVVGAGVALGIEKLADIANKPAKQEVQRFKPSQEIRPEIDEQTFKAVAHDLFAFADEVNAGDIGFYWPLKEGARYRDISFKTKDEYGTITFVWGLKQTSLLGQHNFESTAREIIWYIVSNDQTMRNDRLVAFAKDSSVYQFIPAPFRDRENGIVEPQILNSQQMAEFLRKTIDYFNYRV